jgi:virginiamycin B lyase
VRGRQQRAYPWHRAARGVWPASRLPARLAAVLLVGLLLLAVASALLGGGSRLAVPPSPSATPSVSPSSGPTSGSPPTPTPIPITAEAVIPVDTPIAMVADGPDLWVLAPGRLDRIDPIANGVTASIPLGEKTDLYNGLAANADGLWATDSDANLVYRADPATLKLVKEIPAEFAPKGVAATDAGVWVALTHSGAVIRIDPTTNKIAGTVTIGPTGPSGPNWLASGLGSIWVDVPNNATVARISPVTDRVQATISAPYPVVPCGGIAVGTSAVWVTSCSAGNLMTRIDPASNRVVATIDMGGLGFVPVLIDDRPWVSVDTGTPDGGFIARIDPATNVIDRVVSPGASFGGGGDIVVAAGSVWVVDGYHNTVIRLQMSAFAP